MPKELKPVGRARGGNARAEKLTAEQRTDIAKRAAVTRWAGDVPKAVCGSSDRPLRIGDAEIACYVLEDDRRVLVQLSMISALGMSAGTGGGRGADRLASFVHQERFKGLVSKELGAGIDNPIRFLARGIVMSGYNAEVLAEICFVVDEAARLGRLQPQQTHIAHQARTLMKAFAVVGINALVDEATGYQEIRAKNALARILEKFIAKEFRPWTKTFPVEFYEQMFRLRGWSFDPSTWQGPRAVAKYTNDLVYERLAPGVLDELRAKNPLVYGRRKQKHHQWLTGEVGHPKLLAHLEGVKTLMQISDSWNDFVKRLDQVYPKHDMTELGMEVKLATRLTPPLPVLTDNPRAKPQILRPVQMPLELAD